jgi:pimeloyl-ACP methyl ester carboxylesterase
LATATETIVEANGVDICVETFGDRADPAILLIMGGGASMVWWETAFCRRLADGGRFVIRYDHRDTGRSVSYPPGRAPYTGDDLIADAVGVLDALGVAQAHVVGMSMGGALAQVVAVDSPERVASLTLISTTAASSGERDLPPITKELAAHFAAMVAPDASDRDAVVDFMVSDWRAHASPTQPFDDASVRRLAEQDVDRARDVAATLANHPPGEGDPWQGTLDDVRAPTLVVHGTDDPLFPLEHGRALAREIPGAELLVLEGSGHEVPRRIWDVLVPAILRHTSRG